MIGERAAVRLRVRGVVQGVGYRPFVYRTAHQCGVGGWVRNDADGVEIHAEGEASDVARFTAAIASEAPPAASVASVEEQVANVEGLEVFAIRQSAKDAAPTARVSPDLPVCAACLAELFDPSNRRFGYPYINCTDCGPRYSIIYALPYDRPATTMREWTMCSACSAEYHDPGDRRFHAQPVACPACGPAVVLECNREARPRGGEAIAAAAAMLRAGAILAVKGIGGYHLACDARNGASVRMLRERKYRKERPFAIMARDVAVAREAGDLSCGAEALLEGIQRPIVLVPARTALPDVAPANREIGLMLPYTPLHHLLFADGAPDLLVMTSANRSSEPIAYEDDDARASLAGIADAFLVGERAIARRVDDSVVRCAEGGTSMLRRSRGYVPAAVARFPASAPILAVGGDSKNAIALVVDGVALVSQHVGDLSHYSSRCSFEETIRDLCAMYEVRPERLRVAHDAHPEYVSTAIARELGGESVAVQHHRAHVASVLAERDAWDEEVVAIAFDGTGWGDDATIWGGEIFAGSIRGGFARVSHLRRALLPGGDAAARFPVQAAAGFLATLDDLPDLTAAPFDFPARYRAARHLALNGTRTFVTTSVGRLFDTVAALCGFTREATFEGQAAMWLEHLAAGSTHVPAYPFPLRDDGFDAAPALRAVIADRVRERDVAEIAFAFHRGIADLVVDAAAFFPDRPVIVSGGVFQNALLCELLAESLGGRLWRNLGVPPNDGGLALGQAALAAVGTTGRP